MKSERKKFLSLFLVFLKIGTFTFGGGYAMVYLIQKEIVEKRKWISEEDISNIITISETTPGPIAINIATYVGYKMAGIFGAFCATLGTIFSPFCIVLILSTIFQNFQNNEIFQNALFGIRAVVIALLIKLLIDMFKKSAKSIYFYITIIISLILVLLLKVNTIIIIVSFFMFRLIAYVVNHRKEEK